MSELRRVEVVQVFGMEPEAVLGLPSEALARLVVDRLTSGDASVRRAATLALQWSLYVALDFSEILLDPPSAEDAAAERLCEMRGLLRDGR